MLECWKSVQSSSTKLASWLCMNKFRLEINYAKSCVCTYILCVRRCFLRRCTEVLLVFVCGFYISTFSEIERCVSVFSRYILITVTLREFQIHVEFVVVLPACLPACLGLILINVVPSALTPSSLVRPSCLPCRLLLFVFVFTLYNFQIRMCSYTVIAWYNCKRDSKKYCGILMPVYSSFSFSYYSLYCVLVQRIHIHQSHTHTSWHFSLLSSFIFVSCVKWFNIYLIY